MKDKLPPIPIEGAIRLETAHLQIHTGRTMATRDQTVIRQWAERHGAEPATGEASESGPATIHVNDGDSGIRFNFPGMHRFRPISWQEWFDHFGRHRLVFVYEEDVAERAYELWQARGGGHGGDRGDWFDAERELGSTGRLGSDYRIVGKG